MENPLKSNWALALIFEETNKSVSPLSNYGFVSTMNSDLVNPVYVSFSEDLHYVLQWKNFNAFFAW